MKTINLYRYDSINQGILEFESTDTKAAMCYVRTQVLDWLYCPSQLSVFDGEQFVEVVDN